MSMEFVNNRPGVSARKQYQLSWSSNLVAKKSVLPSPHQEKLYQRSMTKHGGWNDPIRPTIDHPFYRPMLQFVHIQHALWVKTSNRQRQLSIHAHPRPVVWFSKILYIGQPSTVNNAAISSQLLPWLHLLMHRRCYKYFRIIKGLVDQMLHIWLYRRRSLKRPSVISS